MASLKNKARGWSRRLSPAHLIPISFIIPILVGTGLLLLPAASATGQSVGLTCACFTATTSVCVTGLVVTDTYAAFSTLGHGVILLLIQLGGMGTIAVVTLVLMCLRRRFSLAERILIKESFNLDQLGGMIIFLRRVVRGILSIELAGALLYSVRFIPSYGPLRGAWYSLFHAVSAFCNAGIDLLGPDSLIPYAHDPYILFITMGLIILGGLGYVVWFDVGSTVKLALQRRYPPGLLLRRLSEHTKLVGCMTLGLILAGAVGIFMLEHDNPLTLGNMSLGEKWLGSLFQSVTLRTAGFAALPQEGLTQASCLLGCLWMFIGGSPVGTAGGVKTVTFFLVACNALSYIRGRRQVVVFHHGVPEDMMHKAAAILLVSALTTLGFTLALLATGPISLADALYETTSALATVGLTRGLTQSLSLPGKWLIIAAMYLGRIGPISMAIAFTKPQEKENALSYANGRFYVG